MESKRDGEHGVGGRSEARLRGRKREEKREIQEAKREMEDGRERKKGKGCVEEAEVGGRGSVRSLFAKREHRQGVVLFYGTP